MNDDKRIVSCIFLSGRLSHWSSLSLLFFKKNHKKVIALGVFVLMSENKIKVVETKQTINQL